MWNPASMEETLDDWIFEVKDPPQNYTAGANVDVLYAEIKALFREIRWEKLSELKEKLELLMWIIEN